MTTGTCKHGQFVLTEGCLQCIAEQRAADTPPEPAETPPAETADSERFLVKVRYYSRSKDEAGDQEYTYYSEDRLKVGDVVKVPVRNHTATAIVTAIDVPEAEVAAYADLIKVIPSQKPERLEKAAEWEPAAAEAPAEPEAVEEPTPIPDSDTRSSNLYSNTPEDIHGEEAVEVSANQVLIQIAPDADPRVTALYEEAVHLQELAEARIITTNEDLKSVTEDLAAIAKLKRALTEKKDEFVQPVRRYLNTFNEVFKRLMEPIEAADRITRDKMTTFGEDQRRKIADAAQLDADKLNVAQREAALHQGEHTQDLTPVEAPPEAPQRVRTDIGTASTTKLPKWDVEDLSKVPIEYLKIDAGKVWSVVKASKGSITIPGIRIWLEDSITVRTR